MTKIKIVEDFVKEKMGHDPTGHDWYHADRVRITALNIAKDYKNVDIRVIEIASLIHDVIDTKITQDPKKELNNIVVLLDKAKLTSKQIDSILFIIQNMSFKAGIKKVALPIEGQIVQDADRLDALGAIGIARAFAYGGYKNRSFYDPKIAVQTYKAAKEYRNTNSTTINHFYEKLFKLKDLMNTPQAKKIAENREKFMKIFIQNFYLDWEGKSYKHPHALELGFL